MPHQFIGASIEPPIMPLWALFEVNTMSVAEAKCRGWKYIEAIGYNPYKQKILDIAISKRGTVDVVTIRATFEENFTIQTIDLDIPLKQFEALVPPPDRRVAHDSQ